MTKMRLIVIIVLVLLLFAVAAVVSGNRLMLYVDIASFILVIIVPFILISIIFPFSEQRIFFSEVLSVNKTPDTGILEQALVFLESFKKIILCSAVLWTIMGAIGIGAHLEGPEALGLNFGVLMIVPLYATMFLLVVIEPLRAGAKKKLTE